MKNDLDADTESNHSESSSLDLDPEGVDDLIGGVEIDIPEDDQTLTLAELMTDITAGHYELDSYRRASLTIVSAIDDRIAVAEEEGKDDLVALLEEVRAVADALYTRIDPAEEHERTD